MAECTVCSATIIFGGRRLGEHVFCNSRCMMQGRALLAAEGGEDELWDVIAELRDEMLIMAEEMHELRTSLAEANERLNFSERVLTQLKESTGRADGETRG